MITVSHLANWASTNAAQAELPRLIRRLVHAVASTTQITIPAGDSIVFPGFDGELYSAEGNSWVPAGHSCWELSCRADVSAKANEDFEKRTSGTLEEVRQDRTYVAVMARRWRDKTRWQQEKVDQGLWKSVRAYDVDDIEQWLEQAPAVALAFAEELGIAGPGVESPAAYLKKWGAQSLPVITREALLTGRDDQAGWLRGRISRILNSGTQDSLAIKSDSVQEAVAFVAAALLDDDSLQAAAVIVTDVNGWRFVEKNTNIRIAVAATPAIAEKPVVRPGLAFIVPYASGDMARQFKGVAGELTDSELQLERAKHSEFESALQVMGLDENETRRLSTLCGRSWSVFRRQHAVNPAIRRPAWLDHPASRALTVVCLVGTWSTEREADIEIVSRIGGKPYAELEADLLELERLDDSPLLHIGSIWKAKSALELLAIFGSRIDRDSLDRFFLEVRTVLAEPDPQLELPDEERYAAAIHGKIRPISGFMLEALCDTLIKLAVRGPDISSLAANGISIRVDGLVRTLLRGADRIRWLSLTSQLPALAEASPHEFLVAVEEGIVDPDGSIQAIFSESKQSGFGGRCWHAGMLWALETLAWAPNRLKRVSLILAKLCDIRIEGNWANAPQATLLDIYRSWYPQTAATIEQRIEAIDFLIETTPANAYTLIDSLTYTGPDSANHTARPKWRDDDAGAGYGATIRERNQMMFAAIDRQIEVSKGDPDRIAKLVDKFMTFDGPRRQRILQLLHECRDVSDAKKEILRASLRYKLHWHRNYDEACDEALIGRLDAAYIALEPDDLVIRHAWLFHSHWVEMPSRIHDDEQDRYGTEHARLALREIFDKLGWNGVLKLATDSGQPWVVGSHISQIGLPREDLERWITLVCEDLKPEEICTQLAGAILCSLSIDERNEALDSIIKLASEASRDVKWIMRLLMLCPHGRAIWQRAEALGESDFFWKNCSGNFWALPPEDKAFGIRNLVDQERPVTALYACSAEFSPHDPETIVEMIEGILKGYEVSEGCELRGYELQHAIDFLEKSGRIDEIRLAQLEFPLIRALGLGKERHAKSLYHSLMSRPEVFVELLCLIYKPRHEEVIEVDEANGTAAENAWHVLHACRRQPGTNKDGTIDPKAFSQFVSDTRKLAQEKDRLEVCDVRLGEIMAYAPEGDDGIWPFEVARDVLEHSNSAEMLNGLHVGCFNKIGVRSRGVYEGGGQERNLADRYRKYALALEPTHGRLSAELVDVARAFERDGIREDLEAKLRLEEH